MKQKQVFSSIIVYLKLQLILLQSCNIFTEKVKDEKFNKLKDFYVKLREEHIAMLREVSFQLSGIRPLI